MTTVIIFLAFFVMCPTVWLIYDRRWIMGFSWTSESFFNNNDTKFFKTRIVQDKCGKYGLVRGWKYIVRPKFGYNFIFSAHEGFILHNRKKIGYISDDGTGFIHAVYDEIRRVSGVFIVRDGAKWAICAKTPNIYDAIEHIYAHYYALWQDKEFKIYNNIKNEIIFAWGNGYKSLNKGYVAIRVGKESHLFLLDVEKRASANFDEIFYAGGGNFKGVKKGEELVVLHDSALAEQEEYAKLFAKTEQKQRNAESIDFTNNELGRLSSSDWRDWSYMS